MTCESIWRQDQSFSSLCPLLLFVEWSVESNSWITGRFDISIIDIVEELGSNAGSFVDPSIDSCE